MRHYRHAHGCCSMHCNGCAPLYAPTSLNCTGSHKHRLFVYVDHAAASTGSLLILTILLHSSLTQPAVLERFLETGTLDIPALDESFTQQEAAQVKATLESAYGDLPPDVLNTINSLAAADGSPGDADGSPGDAEAAGQLVPFEEFDAEEWEERALEMLEARFAEEGISLEDALDGAVAEAVADAEAEEALLERGMERASGRLGVAGAVGGGAGRCWVGGGRGEGLQWLWLGRNGWAPVAVRSATRLGGGSSSSSGRHC